MLEQARNKQIYNDKQLFAAEAAPTNNTNTSVSLCLCGEPPVLRASVVNLINRPDFRHTVIDAARRVRRLQESRQLAFGIDQQHR